ncbi:MAG: ATP-binding cassette domain-containing protein [Phycisphaerales bacterium]
MQHANAGEWLVDLTGVEKVYRGGWGRRGRVHALRGCDFRVRRGEVFGLLGPNGAGKSTLVKIMMTLIRATRATGTVLGKRIGDREAISKMGYLPEHHRFPDYLTGEQMLRYSAAMAGVDLRARRSRAKELLDVVGMGEWGRKPLKSYSKGMRQRVGIAQALMNDPLLVVLDEPTDGVDPVGRRDIRMLLQKLRDEGRTVILNSHLLSELEMVCDRVSILVQGRVVSHGTLDELTSGKRGFEVEVVGGAARETLEASAKAAGVTWEIGASNGVARARLETTDLAVVQRVIDGVRREGVSIRTVREVRPTLEDLFIEAVSDPTTGRALGPGAKMDGKEGRQ